MVAGIFRFNPDDVKYLKPASIPLCPHECAVGTDIRVVGNDAGEKLSVLSGVLSRKDRGAPNYGLGRYNDMNTFYVAAASNTSGGSSGSPVLNVAGHAVALNAGGNTRSASSYYLPLERIVRAVRLVQAGVQVPRGCTGAVWRHQPFDEAKRMGLAPAQEALVRDALPAETGMLTVHKVVPGTHSKNVLEPGDVLLHINQGSPRDSSGPPPFVTHFQALEEACDNAVAASQTVQAAAMAVCARLGMPPSQLRRAARQAAAAEWSGEGPPPSWHRVPRWHCEIGIDGEHVAVPGAFVSVPEGTAALGQLHPAGTSLEQLVAQQDTSLQAATPVSPLVAQDALSSLHALLVHVLQQEQTSLPQVDLAGSEDCSADGGVELQQPVELVASSSTISADAQPAESGVVSATTDGSFRAHRRHVTPADLQHVVCGAFEESCALHGAMLQRIRDVSAAAESVLSALQSESSNTQSLQTATQELLAVALRCTPSVALTVARGGEEKELVIAVHNEHMMVPWQLVSVSGSSLHDISFQMAYGYSVAPVGQFVSTPGYMLAREAIFSRNILHKINHKPTRSCLELVSSLADLPDGTRVPVAFRAINNSFREFSKVITVDRHWSSTEVLTRNDVTGQWMRETLPQPPARPAVPKRSLVVEFEGPSQLPPASAGLSFAQHIFDCMVRVEANHCYLVDGAKSDAFFGTGIVADSERGIIVVDRNTIVNAVSDVRVIVAGSVELDARVLFLHPCLNFALITVDTSVLKTPLRAMKLTAQRPLAGEERVFVGTSSDGELMQHKVTVTRPLETVHIWDGHPPRFRAYNEECISVDRIVDSTGGVYVNEQGEACAMLCSYSNNNSKNESVDEDGCLAFDNVLDVLSGLAGEAAPPVESFWAADDGSFPAIPSASWADMGIELGTVPLSTARAGLSLPEEWVPKLTQAAQGKRQVLIVSRCMPESDASSKLQPNDVILEVGSQVTVTFRAFLAKVQELQGPPTGSADGPIAIPMLVLREGKLVQTAVIPALSHGQETRRLVGFQGLMVQLAPLAVMMTGYTPTTGRLTPYISRWAFGSPSHKHGIRAMQWVTHVNGEVTPTLDAFLDIVCKLKHGDNARFTFENKQGNTTMGTIKVDIGYWPTAQLQLAENGEWHMSEFEHK